MNIHMNRPNSNIAENGEAVGEIDIDKMKRYISYCKSYVPSALLQLMPSEQFETQEMCPSTVARRSRNAEQPFCWTS